MRVVMVEGNKARFELTAKVGERKMSASKGGREGEFGKGRCERDAGWSGTASMAQAALLDAYEHRMSRSEAVRIRPLVDESSMHVNDGAHDSEAISTGA